MLCKKPFQKGSVSFGCNQCLPCRLSRRRLWTSRILLEALKHEDNSFITLTYSEENLPPNGSLVIRDYQLFLKNLRYLSDKPIRYFLVGEYGEQTFRPHYHSILFGIGPCYYFPTSGKQSQFQRSKCKCPNCEIIRRSWGLGNTDCASLQRESAQYVAGYVTKKLTTADSPRNEDFRRSKGLLLNGRLPEFARMSLRPGIGAHAMDNVAKALDTVYGLKSVDDTGDVPLSLDYSGKSLPLGRYLRRKLREKLGFNEIGAQNGWKEKMANDYYQMRGVFSAQDDIPDYQKFFEEDKKVRAMQKQTILNLEQRANIYRKRGTV